MPAPLLPPELAQHTLAAILPLLASTGEQLCQLAGTLRQSTAKAGVDLVTRADALSEARITAELARLFPDHRIAAEEGTLLGPHDSPWVWHLDPLDGTANYSRGIPYWSISLGLCHRDQPVLGVVHAPLCGITVSGAVGAGAWLGDSALAPPLPVGEPREWMVATDWPWDIAERQRTCRLLAALAPRIRQYKSFGSAALDLAQVASGRLDAYLISHAFAWDLAGGCAALAALGFELRRWDGQPWTLAHHDLVACRPGMWPLLATAIGEAAAVGA